MPVGGVSLSPTRRARPRAAGNVSCIRAKGVSQGKWQNKARRHGREIALSPTRRARPRTARNAIPSGQRVPPEEAAKQSCAAMVGGSPFRQRAGRGRGRRGTFLASVQKGFPRGNGKTKRTAMPVGGSPFRQRAGRGRGRRTEARKEGSKGFAVQKASQGNALFPQFEHDVLFAGAFKAAMLVKLVGAAAVRIQVKAAVRFPARKLIEQ